MMALCFDYRDIFKANRLAFSLQRIWIQLTGLIVGYSGYLILTYLAFVLSGHSLPNMWKQMGVFPCLAGHDANVISWIVFILGTVFLGAVVLITNTAVSRSVYMLVKGNYFYTWKEAFRFSIKKSGAVLFGPIAILVLIGLFFAGGAVVGLLGKIPIAGELGLSILYLIWVACGLLIIFFIIVLAASLFLAPAVIATTDDDAFEAVFQSFSLVWSQPWRLIIYQALSAVMAVFALLVFAFLVKKGFLVVDSLFANIVGDKYCNMAAQGMYMLKNWLSVSVGMISSWLGDYTSLVYFGRDFLQLNISPILQVSAVIYALMMLLIGSVVVSYGLASFQAGTTLTYIVLRMKRENDNVLERKDREEEDEENIESEEEKEEPEAESATAAQEEGSEDTDDKETNE